LSGKLLRGFAADAALVLRAEECCEAAAAAHRRNAMLLPVSSFLLASLSPINGCGATHRECYQALSSLKTGERSECGAQPPHAAARCQGLDAGRAAAITYWRV